MLTEDLACPAPQHVLVYGGSQVQTPNSKVQTTKSVTEKTSSIRQNLVIMSKILHSNDISAWQVKFYQAKIRADFMLAKMLEDVIRGNKHFARRVEEFARRDLLFMVCNSGPSYHTCLIICTDTALIGILRLRK